MAINQANKQKWNDTVEKISQQLNLSEEEVITIKEWGVALLVTGVSAWLLYRLVRKIFGPSKKTVKIKVEQPKAPSDYRTDPPPKATDKRRPSRKKSSSTSSPWFPLIRKYAGPLLLALARRQINRYLRTNSIIR